MHQKKQNDKLIFAKKAISWTLGIPAVIIFAGEIENLSFCWLQFAAFGALILILQWNGVFREKNPQVKFVSRRRSF